LEFIQHNSVRFAQSTDYGSYRIGNYYTDMHKLQKEIAIIQFLLDSLMSEVKRYGTFTFDNGVHGKFAKHAGGRGNVDGRVTGEKQIDRLHKMRARQRKATE
jgi:hypothetical protein